MLSDKFCHLSKQQLLINRSINSKRSRNLRHFYNMKMGRDLFSHFQIIKQPDLRLIIYLAFLLQAVYVVTLQIQLTVKPGSHRQIKNYQIIDSQSLQFTDQSSQIIRRQILQIQIA